MFHHTELSINIRTFPFKERDKVVVFLTENQGKITGLAKGGVGSKRFGGTLDFLSCSKIHYVEKPNAEMVRIDEADFHHEFKNIHKDIELLSAASFAAEYCLRLLEPSHPSREMFVVLSNFLFRLDEGMPVLRAVNAFLCKSFRVMGYAPSLLRCSLCGKGAGDVSSAGAQMYWSSEAGGMHCSSCTSGANMIPLESELLLYFHDLTMESFQKIHESVLGDDKKIFRILNDFLHHHIPGLPSEGLRSLKILAPYLA